MKVFMIIFEKQMTCTCVVTTEILSKTIVYFKLNLTISCHQNIPLILNIYNYSKQFIAIHLCIGNLNTKL